MFLNTQNNVIPTTETLLSLLENLNNAEIGRNTNEFIDLIEPYWKDMDQDFVLPDHVRPEIKAELFKLCGFFQSYIGYTKAIKGIETSYQVRGKQLIWKSIRLFVQLGLQDEAASAKVKLAACYVYDGEYEAAESILTETESDYQDNPFHPVALNCNITRLVTLFRRGELGKAEEMLKRLQTRMKFCKDPRILARYHNQVGNHYALSKKHDLAFSHMQEAIKYAKRIKNLRFVAMGYNNQAYILLNLGQFQEVHKLLDKGQKILKRLGDHGWLAVLDDTRAQSFMAEDRIDEAETSINKSIGVLTGTKNYQFLCESLKTRVKIYMRTDRITLAIADVITIHEIAKDTLKNNYTEKFVDEELKDLIFPIVSNNLIENLKEFKKFLIKTTLKKTSNDLNEAAESLGIKPTELARYLSQELPELFSELGLKFKAKSKQPRKKSKKINNQKSIVFLPLHGPKPIFNFSTPAVDPSFYYCDEVEMRRLCGIPVEGIVTVFPVDSPGIGSLVLAQLDDFKFFSKVELSDEFTLKVSHQLFGDFELEELILIGEPFGFAPFFGAADQEFIEFTKIEY